MEEKSDSKAPKMALESLSKEEILQKYKSLLNIAKKAKQAKDELTEENRELKEALSHSMTQKEADKQSLKTMQEMLEQFTEQKLDMTTKLMELQQQHKVCMQKLSEREIENESLQRQLQRTQHDNEILLNGVAKLDNQLHQVKVLGKEQEKQFSEIEKDVLRLQKAEIDRNIILSKYQILEVHQKATEDSLKELKEKYEFVKHVNSEQRRKFNALKDRFNDVKNQVNKLQACKKILLETQHEYADAVSSWQSEIIKASQQLFSQMLLLKVENEQLQQENSKLQKTTMSIDIQDYLLDLKHLCEKAQMEQTEIKIKQDSLENENKQLQLQLQEKDMTVTDNLETKQLTQELSDIRLDLNIKLMENKKLIAENEELKVKLAGTGTDIEIEPEEHDILKRLDDMEKLCHEKSLENNKLRTALEETHDALEKIEQENIILLEQMQHQLNNPTETVDASLKIDVEDEVTEDYIIMQQQQQQQQHYNELQEVNKNLMQRIFEMKEEQDKLKMQLVSLNIDKLDNEDLRKQLENKRNNLFKDLTIEINQLKQYFELEEKIIKELQNKEIEKSAIKDMEEERRNFDKLKQEWQTESAEQQNIIKLCEKEKAKLCTDLKKLSVESEEKLIREREANEVLKMEIEALKIKITQNYEELKEKFEADKQKYILEYNLQQSTNIGTEQKDLLEEMRELNEALKARGDVISRQEEKQQELLAELKRKNGLLQQSESSVEQLQTTLNEKEEEIQNLKRSIDNMHETQSEVSTLSHMEDMQQLRDIEESFEDKYNKVRQLAIKLKKKLQDQNVDIERLEQEVNTLKADNQKLKSKGKQTNMLNLEIEAAEKTLKDHADKLTAKTRELQSIKNELEQKETNIRQLKQQMDLLEAEKQAECKHSLELRQQIDTLQNKIKTVIHEQQETLISNQDLQQKLEQQTEELQKHREQQMLHGEKQQSEFDDLQQKYKQLEIKCTQTITYLQQTQQRNSLLEKQLEEIKKEYNDYKMKAQTVLRKQQSESEKVKLTQLESTLANMQQQQQLLESKLQLKEQELNNVERKLESVVEENVEFEKQHKQMTNMLENIRKDNMLLKEQQQEQTKQQQEALKEQRLYIEQLKENYEGKLQELQHKYEQVKKQQQQLQQTVDNKSHNVAAMNARDTLDAANKIDLLLMEREAAEGSEEVLDLNTLAAHRKISNIMRPQLAHEFMPLDELLNAPDSALTDTVITVDGYESDPQKLLLATQERLEQQDKQVRHLTSLLAENEQDLAKLSQMNDMLKEELRRQERSVERQEEMHNLEYLKNIVIKFLTLNNNDERTRLVPVLNTILKLSRTEVELLSNAAKGQKVSSNNNSWNFLPWSGSNN